jgi:sigma-E factor negative regulatory protein RseB
MRAYVAIKLLAGILGMSSAPFLFGLAYAETNVSLSAMSSQSTEVSLSSPTWWLKKMGEALRSENYAGNFSYIRGSRFDSVRIVHLVDEGRELERLFNLNGDARELYREDGEVRCYHASSDLSADGLAKHDVHIGPFTPVFSDRVLATQDLYNLAMEGEDRIAGRRAVILTVSPRFNDRYGYKVWLDEETGLLLQSHLIERGRIKEIFQFTNIKFGEFVSKSSLQTAIVGSTISHPLTLDFNEKEEKPVWKVNWLPDGFRPVRIQGNRLHFTDGLATLSVFIESSDPAPMPDLTTTDGGTVVITRRHQKTGPQITLVGEIPVRTAQRVAESVELVLY